MAQRNRLGDLEIDRVLVAEDRVVRPHEEAVVELGGEDVDEERVVRAVGDRLCPVQAPELGHRPAAEAA